MKTHLIMPISSLFLASCHFADVVKLNPDIFIARYESNIEGEEEHMEALLEGVLVVQEKCLRIKSFESQTFYTPIWSPVSTQRHQIIISDETLTIYDHEVLKATLNQNIVIAGGEVIDRTQINASIPEQCPGPYWLVGEWPVEKSSF